MDKRPIIAVVKLAPSRVGYYDEYSRIHLTHTDPQREIYAGTNCKQLRHSVKQGGLILLCGSLDPDATPLNVKENVANEAQTGDNEKDAAKADTDEVKEDKKSETQENLVDEKEEAATIISEFTQSGSEEITAEQESDTTNSEEQNDKEQTTKTEVESQPAQSEVEQNPKAKKTKVKK